MLSGTIFSLRLEALRFSVYTPGMQIKRQQSELPNLHFDLGPLCVALAIQDERLIAKVLIKEIKLLDYFKKEMEKSSIRHIQGSISKANLHADESYYHGHQGNPATMRQFEIYNNLHETGVEPSFSRSNFQTPSKGNRITEVLYGALQRDASSRQSAFSRQTNAPHDMLNFDIPDPSKA